MLEDRKHPVPNHGLTGCQKHQQLRRITCTQGIIRERARPVAQVQVRCLRLFAWVAFKEPYIRPFTWRHNDQHSQEY